MAENDPSTVVAEPSLSTSITNVKDPTTPDIAQVQKDVPPPPAHFGLWKFCPLCKSDLTRQHICDQERLACSADDCRFVHWDNPKPVVVAVVLTGNDVLLTRRKYPPQPGTFCLPGGFVEAHESAETACVREVEEETGLKVEIVKLLGIYSPTLGANELVLAFQVKIIGGSLIAGEEVSESTFFPLNNLPPDIGFSQHREIIQNWTNR